MLGVTGCASSLRTWRSNGWYNDYEAAERAASDTGRNVLICYRDDRQGRDDVSATALRSPKLSHLTEKFVCCDLFRSYEPDRRYVGQFGVNRAPALILVRGDGTYHAMPGTSDVARIEAFLSEADTPGKPVTVDPYVVRQARYDWSDSLETAESIARETGRPLFVVFYRTLSRDWSRLSKMLQRPEVGQRLNGAVPVRIGLWGLKADAYDTQFGALSLPALVLVQPDGSVQDLQLPASCEQIVRFIETAFAPTRAAEPSPTKPAATAMKRRS